MNKMSFHVEIETNFNISDFTLNKLQICDFSGDPDQHC